LPEMAFGTAQPGKLLPRFSAVRRLENRCVFHAGIDCVRIGQGRLEMPDALEFPRMLRAVVPLVRPHFAFIDELVAFAFGRTIGTGQLLGAAAGCLPGLAAIVGALDNLAEPTARLRRVDAVRLSGRAFEVIHFPAREVQPADFPILALAVRRQDERALLCADQYSDFAHFVSCAFCQNSSPARTLKRAKAALRSAALTPLHRSTNRECRALSDDHFGSCSISICAVFID